MGGGQAVDGTGLGLAITQRLILLLGGEALRVESKPGQGSRFSFWIPYQAAGAEHLALPAAAAAPPGRGRHDGDGATPVPVGPSPSTWPAGLAEATAHKIAIAVDQGDVARLFDLADELATDPSAPRADVENLALMARMFDFDGLRALSKRLQADA